MFCSFYDKMEMDVKKELLLSYKKIKLEKTTSLDFQSHGRHQGQRAQKSPNSRSNDARVEHGEVGFSMTQSKALLNMLSK